MSFLAIRKDNADPLRVQTWLQMSACIVILLEPLSKHLQVCIPHQEGERWEPLL